VNTTLLHRRRIERLAQLLDEADGARRHHTRSRIDNDLNDLVAVGHRLADIHPEVEMRDEARRRVRAMIMAKAESDGIGVTAKTVADPAIGRAKVGAIAGAPGGRRPFARRVRARGAVLVGLAVGTVAISGIAAASGGAMPGDALYGLKRSQETAQLQLLTSPVSRGQFYFGLARKRLTEAQAVDKDPNRFQSLLNDMKGETQAGAKLLFSDAVNKRDRQALATVDAFYGTQKQAVDAFKDRLQGNDARREPLVVAEMTLDLLDLRLNDLEAVMSCPAITQLAPDHYGWPQVEPCNSSADPSTAGPTAPATPGTGHGSTSPSGLSNGNPDTTRGTPAGSTTPGASGDANTSAVGIGAAALLPAGTDGGLLTEIGQLLGGLID
jgi:hypothetical protein